MLFALLFDNKDRLVAAAPAVDQQPFGNAFWRDAYPQPLRVSDDWQTAYLEINEPSLIDDLSSLATDDTRLDACRSSIEALAIKRVSSQPHRSPRAA